MYSEQQVDDLLNAFENPEGVSNVSEVNSNPVVQNEVNNISMDSLLPPELQNVPDAVTPVAPNNFIPEAPVSTPEVTPDVSVAPSASAIDVASAAPTPVAQTEVSAPQVSTPAQVETNESINTNEGNMDNQEVSQVNGEIATENDVTSTSDTSAPAPVDNVAKEEQDEPDFLKKNIKFIAILFGVVLLFIIFLPKIINIFGGAY